MPNFIILLKSILTSETALVVAIVAIFIILWFLYKQVYNHIPTDIKEIKQDIKEVKQELKQDINGLEDRMDRLEDKMDKLNENMNNNFHKLYQILIDDKNKK